MKKLVVLTGAGMSAESGIATFRGGGGLWNNYPVEQVATPEGFAADPALVLDFYNHRHYKKSCESSQDFYFAPCLSSTSSTSWPLAVRAILPWMGQSA